ncbi:hypothetical protein UA08_04673 [Talaromyces atroroseus]|uniref:GST N-terminal domain-containing protein n=1 Tax=Talaromyces atroroseus TaxID=1441469 RepID=A0A225AFK9_TALAT|nr:hypothetical protein UA08_04673 [Talaromyces atroroseus]OKL60122.1 hypothetical protein UA08_04673 [Talaromyces atroroseus]
MDSSELPHLPVSLPLGSQLSSGFNANESPAFQGFSTAIGDIDHELPAVPTFAHPSHFNAHDSASTRYDIAPSSRSTQELRANGKLGLSIQEAAGHISQVFNTGGELAWVSTSLSSLQQPGRIEPVPQEARNGSETSAEIKDSHVMSMRIVPNPPDLDLWRERLFNVDEPIMLTEEQFNTYFPHVDNIYSHRSTQKYKRKPFVSHYWDCRLKGRPPGTPKSDDPNKKKRKRVARERDLCDVKIKITEYFPGAVISADPADQKSALDSLSNSLFFPDGGGTRASQPFGVLTSNPALPINHSITGGQKLYTIQRVNGNGGNGKTDGIEGGHRHTLEESDRVKKNSVHRYLLKKAKDEKKEVQKQAQAKTYHKKATGEAHETVKKHSKECELKLFGSCFCFALSPFVQRIWIALEAKGIPYQYIEVDPYEKPPELLEINPRGLVPAILHGNWGCYESTVLLEYLEDLDEGPPLLPPGDAKLRAHCRLWADHVKNAEELKEELVKLVNASHVHGPFFLGPSMSYVDIQLAPWIIRLSRVLKPYRGWPEPEMGSRWGRWVQAIEDNEHVMATTSSDELYLDSYVRYMENRPNTSQLADAINSGRGLP